MRLSCVQQLCWLRTCTRLSMRAGFLFSHTAWPGWICMYQLWAGRGCKDECVYKCCAGLHTALCINAAQAAGKAKQGRSALHACYLNTWMAAAYVPAFSTCMQHGLEERCTTSSQTNTRARHPWAVMHAARLHAITYLAGKGCGCEPQGCTHKQCPRGTRHWLHHKVKQGVGADGEEGGVQERESGGGRGRG